MKRKPRIAVIMDENTSVDGTRYDVAKSYFVAVHQAGGLPFGIPYFPDLVATVTDEFDGLLSVGGRIRFPKTWYREGDKSLFPVSERLEVEEALMRSFLQRDKPVLGICNGMQMLACLNGGRMVHNVRAHGPDIFAHDVRGELHPVSVTAGTALADIVKVSRMDVNTRHREAVVDVSDAIVVSARADDGTVEAIEIPSRRFAFGLQWHQEAFVTSDHPGNGVFDAFVAASY